MTLKTAMQQTKPPLYLYHLNCFCPAHFKALLKLATSIIFNLSSDRSFFIRQGGWWDLRRGGGGGVPKIWLKWGPCRQKNIGCKGGITKIILSSFAVTANNLPEQNDTKKTSLSDVQPEVHIFYFLREACPHSPYFIMRKTIAILPHPTNRKIIA